MRTGRPPVGGRAGTPKINGLNNFVFPTKSSSFLFLVKLMTEDKPPFLNSCNCFNKGNKDLFSRDRKVNPL